VAIVSVQVLPRSAAAQVSGHGGFYQKGPATPRRAFRQNIVLNSLDSITFMRFDRLDQNAT
jgi:hypothetical protein